VTQLSSELTGSNAVIAVGASGNYDNSANTFTASRVAVLLTN
jgi:hypothetical protein